MLRYMLSNSTAGAAILMQIPPLMSSSAQRRRTSSGSGSGVRIITFNVAKSYFDLDTLLEDSKDDFDVLFIQEPPLQTIRHAPSAMDAEGTPVVGAPRHPQWNCMVRQPEIGSRPRVMTYVSKRLDQLRPAYRRDLIDDRDVMVISLFGEGEPMHLMNVYSDDQHWAIRLIADRSASLPPMCYMGGDFNCHSREWDDNVPHHRTTATLLTETAASMGLVYSRPINPGPTYESRANENSRSVLDLVFVTLEESLSASVRREPNIRGRSDHIRHIDTALRATKGEGPVP